MGMQYNHRDLLSCAATFLLKHSTILDSGWLSLGSSCSASSFPVSILTSESGLEEVSILVSESECGLDEVSIPMSELERGLDAAVVEAI